MKLLDWVLVHIKSLLLALQAQQCDFHSDIWKMDWCHLHVVKNGVNDVFLAMDEGTSEKISEFQVGIEPPTSVMLVGCSHH